MSRRMCTNNKKPGHRCHHGSAVEIKNIHTAPAGPPPPYYAHPPAPGAYSYIPAQVMMPVYQPPPVAAHVEPSPAPATVINNYIYQQNDKPQPPRRYVEEPVDWVTATPATAANYTNRAFVAGKEGWDNSPLWIIRAHHNGELVPGKLAIKHRVAYIPHGGKEVPVHNFDILLAYNHAVRWLTASNGNVPVGAIPAGNTQSGEPLYIARVRHMKSITPGKVHPSHGGCYISFGGAEIQYKNYEVLCKIVG